MRFLHRFSARSAPQFPALEQGRFCAGTGIIIGRTEIIIVRSRSVRNAASIQAPATTSMFELHGSIGRRVHPDKERSFAEDTVISRFSCKVARNLRGCADVSRQTRAEGRPHQVPALPPHPGR